MLGAIAGILDFDNRSIDPDRIPVMGAALGNNNVTREYKAIHPWLHLAQINLNGRVLSIDQYILTERDLSIVGDTHIVNRAELFAKLSIQPYEQVNDHQLVIKTYRKWGVGCVDHLEGYFAFAIWDHTNRRLFCAMDPVGRRPFFFSLVDNEFLFATEIKGILAVGRKTYEHNLTYFVDLIEGLPLDEDATYLKDIFRLAGGTTLIIDSSGKRIHRYWSIQSQDPLLYRKNQDYVDAAEALSVQLTREYFSDSQKLALWINSNKECAYDLAILRRAFPDKEIIGSAYVVPHFGMEKRSAHELRIELLKKRTPFDLIKVYEPMPPTEYQSIQHKFWINDAPLANPIGSDYNVLYQSQQNLGIQHFSMNMFFNPLNWDGREYLRDLMLSGNLHSVIRLLAASPDKLNALRQSILQLMPWRVGAKLKKLIKQEAKNSSILRKGIMDNTDYFKRRDEKMRITGTYPSLYIQRDHTVLLKKRFKPFPKPLTSFEREYGLSSVQSFCDRRMIDFALSIPSDQYRGSRSLSPLFRRMLNQRNVPKQIVHSDLNVSFPIDLHRRRMGIRRAMFKEYDKISKDSSIWRIVDVAKAHKLFEEVRESNHYGIYRNKYERMNKVILVSKFLDLKRKPERTFGDP